MKKRERHSPMVITVLAEYLTALKRLKYSPKSIASYRKPLEQFMAFVAGRGVERLQDVAREDLEAYRLGLVERGVSDHTRELYMRSVRQFFMWMEKNQHIFINPAQGMIVPKAERKLQPIPTEAEMKRLLAQPNVSAKQGLRDRALLEVAYSTGARKEELVRMNVFDPDLKEGRIRILGKGKKERLVPLGKQAVYWLGQYLQHGRPKLLGDNADEIALWIGRCHHKRIHPEIFRLALAEYAAKAKIKTRVTPHSLRRACATHMLAHGAHPVQIQMLLGHASLGTLGQYLCVTIRDMKKMHKQSKPGR